NLLLKKGHRRIAFVNLAPSSERHPIIPASIGRLEGYKKALSEYDVPFDESLLRYADDFPQTNYQHAYDLLQSGNPPTAIFCGNDRTAMGVYGAISALALHIPEAVAVVGFANQQDIAQGLWPPLTTVQLPHYNMGKWAVEYLMQPHDAHEPPIQHLLDCPLV